MIELLKTDFKRVVKDKLFIVMLILGVVFALMTPLLFVAIFSAGNMFDDPLLSSLVTAKSQFFQSFSMTNNLGLIIPVLLAIILRKDFSHGTVRNKIIAGKKRIHIFFSMFTVCATVLAAVMLASAFISLGVSLIFFDYQVGAFTAADFGYFMASLAFDVLVLLFMASLVSWLCACSKNVGVAIVLYVAITFALTMIGSIVQVVAAVMQVMGEGETVLKTMDILNKLNVGMSVSYIGAGTSYTLTDVLCFTLSPIFLSSAFIFFGAFGFSRKDIK